MIKVEEFYFDSRDKKTKIHAIKWIPDREVKFVLQLVHGMAEHIGRYDEFARFLASEGVLVVGSDHLGHGKTAISSDDMGYFCEEDAASVLVRDVHRLKKMIQAEYLTKPYFILGHSMGSYIVRNYICRYGKGIDGALLEGVSEQKDSRIKLGFTLCSIIAIFYGERHKSKLLNKILFGNYNQRIRNAVSENAWMCGSSKVVEAYDSDEKCGFTFTVNGFQTICELANSANNKKNLLEIPQTLPVFILSGSEDPVGSYGKSCKHLFDRYREIGLKDVQFKQYEGCRHELLNEEIRFEIYEEIYHWILKKCK